MLNIFCFLEGGEVTDAMFITEMTEGEAKTEDAAKPASVNFGNAVREYSENVRWRRPCRIVNCKYIVKYRNFDLFLRYDVKNFD